MTSLSLQGFQCTRIMTKSSWSTARAWELLQNTAVSNTTGSARISQTPSTGQWRQSVMGCTWRRVCLTHDKYFLCRVQLVKQIFWFWKITAITIDFMHVQKLILFHKTSLLVHVKGSRKNCWSVNREPHQPSRLLRVVKPSPLPMKTEGCWLSKGVINCTDGFNHHYRETTGTVSGNCVFMGRL